MHSNSLLDQLKWNFRNGSVISRLIIINVAVFLFINIYKLTGFLFSFNAINPLIWISVPASFGELLLKPWTLITYMFVHEDFFHILVNMITLYFAGTLYSDYLGANRILTCYFGGGILGALFYMLCYNIFPAFTEHIYGSILFGASASVMAILVAATVYVPNFVVNLMLFGPVKLKYITIVYVVLDFINIRSGNAGGHLSHIGGALFGYLFCVQLKRGSDWSAGFNRVFNGIGNLFKRRSHLKVAYKKKRSVSDEEYNAGKVATQRKVDAILDKISKSGYESLTKEEKETLFKISNDKR
jgi:membrane associated rhomboid family serine protease